MKNLLKAITNYLNEDVEKLQELESGLSQKIKEIKSVKKVEDPRTITIEDILNEKINAVENTILNVKNQIKKEEEMFLKLYGDRVKKVINIYDKLKKVDYKLKTCGLKSYAHLLERERVESGINNCWIEDKGNRVHVYFHEVSDQYYGNQRVIINGVFYISYDKGNEDLTINIYNRNEYTCDNSYSLVLKDLFSIQRLAKKFEILENKANKIMEEILGGN